MKTTNNKFDNSKGFNHFSGVINHDSNQAKNIFNPKEKAYFEAEHEKEQILSFSPEVEKIAVPEGINKYLLSIMETATNNTNSIFNNNL